MVAYLLMPRPKDLVKGLLIPITYVLELLGGGEVSGGVAAAMTEAGDMTDENLVGAEDVSVRASVGWLGDPLPVGGSD